MSSESVPALRRRSNRELGLTLAAVHLALVTALFLGVRTWMDTSEGWGSMFPWLALVIVDLPFSLVGCFWPAVSVMAWSNPNSTTQGLIGPAVVHGVVGTAWYYFLPHWVRKLRW